jgi:hypothetical protein
MNFCFEEADCWGTCVIVEFVSSDCEANSVSFRFQGAYVADEIDVGYFFVGWNVLFRDEEIVSVPLMLFVVVRVVPLPWDSRKNSLARDVFHLVAFVALEEGCEGFRMATDRIGDSVYEVLHVGCVNGGGCGLG